MCGCINRTPFCSKTQIGNRQLQLVARATTSADQNEAALVHETREVSLRRRGARLRKGHVFLVCHTAHEPAGLRVEHSIEGLELGFVELALCVLHPEPRLLDGRRDENLT